MRERQGSGGAREHNSQPSLIVLSSFFLKKKFICLCRVQLRHIGFFSCSTWDLVL